MWEDGPAKVVEMKACQSSCMGGCIIHMDKAASCNHSSWPVILIRGVKPCDDLSEEDLVDGLWRPDKLPVDHARGIKKVTIITFLVPMFLVGFWGLGSILLSHSRDCSFVSGS